MDDTTHTTVCQRCAQWLQKVIPRGSQQSKVIRILESPWRSIACTFPVRMDDGSVRVVVGYRVQYNNALGPMKGGIRIHPSVSLEETTELGFLMTLKTSLLGLPYGGAKGGICMNPKELSQRELERVSRAYMREIAPFIGPDRDIPAPDVNTDAQTMAWMMDEYECIVGRNVPAVITGKPLELGGSFGRETATARGAFFLIERFFQKRKKGTVAIQGFGNAGLHIANLLYDRGYRVVAVSDASGGWFDKNGIDIPKASKSKNSGVSVAKFSFKGKSITNEELLKLPVDILVPAALGGVITSENAPYVQAKTIFEVANGPIHSLAETRLEKKKITVIPDILTNAGGVVVSYFEWVQNRIGTSWSEKEVDEKLREKMHQAFNDTLERARLERCSLRTASYRIAVDRILQAERLRGRL